MYYVLYRFYLYPHPAGPDLGNIVRRGDHGISSVYTWNTVVICKFLLTKASLMG